MKLYAAEEGFSLIELLIVIAIIGIIGGISTPTLLRARDSARIGEVSARLEADLEQARSSSRRNNQASSLVWNTNNKEYNLVVGGKTFARTIPTGVSVTLAGTSSNSIIYDAPFGEIKGSLNPSFTVQSSSRSDVKETVRVLGVTGKVYRQ